MHPLMLAVPASSNKYVGGFGQNALYKQRLINKHYTK